MQATHLRVSESESRVSESNEQRVQSILQQLQAWPHWDEIASGAQKETGMPIDEFFSVLPEYQRFLALCAIYPGMGMFSDQVDRLWHAHILNTRRYQECGEQLLGRFVHHLPCSSFQLYLNPKDSETTLPICEEPPATCTDPFPAPPDPSPVPDENNPSIENSILGCTRRFVHAYIEAYMVVPPLDVYTHLTEADYADAIAD